MGKRKGAYRVWVGRPDTERPLSRVRPKWEDNIKIDLHEVGRGGIDWIALTQDRDRWQALVTAAMELRVPQYTRNLLTSCGPVSF
jgi:hypothetical protein